MTTTVVRLGEHRSARPTERSGSRRARRRPIRLTRRGRLVVLSVLMVAVAVTSALLTVLVTGRAGAAVPHVAGSSSSATPRSSVLVRPGDTLWAIAGRIAPNADPRVVIDRILAANPTAKRVLVPGERLVLP